MPYSFQPKFFLSLFCILMMLVFCALGLWQLQRADEKQQTQSELEELSMLPPRNLNLQSNHLKSASKALATGHYLVNEQFLLDNIVHKGKPGYYLLSPFLLSNRDEVILVNRGWLAKQQNGLPEFKTPTEQLSLRGILAPPRSKPVILGSIDHPISATPPLWYYMDMEVFQQQSSYKALPLILRLAPEPDSDFVRDWPKFQAKSGMHIGYAIQWFVFAFFVLIALLGINFKSKAKPNKNNSNN